MKPKSRLETMSLKAMALWSAIEVGMAGVLLYAIVSGSGGNDSALFGDIVLVYGSIALGAIMAVVAVYRIVSLAKLRQLRATDALNYFALAVVNVVSLIPAVIVFRMPSN